MTKPVNRPRPGDWDDDDGSEEEPDFLDPDIQREIRRIEELKHWTESNLL